jgi:hypothetical protein
MATAGPREIISIFFPRDFQMARLYAFPTKPMEKIPPAEPGHAVRVRVFETYLEPTQTPGLLERLGEYGRQIGWVTLDDNRHFLICAGVERFDPNTVADLRGGRGPLDIQPEMKVGETKEGLSAVAWSDPDEIGAIRAVEIHGISLRRET